MLITSVKLLSETMCSKKQAKLQLCLQISAFCVLIIYEQDVTTAYTAQTQIGPWYASIRMQAFECELVVSCRPRILYAPLLPSVSSSISTKSFLQKFDTFLHNR